ncbi:hypothetical protein C8E87_0077 [Paractinoplanes brasiliensis]|uniref:Uncharacterized protein n=1 Tax=Paractinoplanes brasiliensis TaxID=52695 RepID=A0A4R6JJY4_9ACTN|nr:hypothetical protein [Actinoplanes brasiliensis]TDO36504.1 hypothetical protein C8E87_0077 [Actinoplanes brasiliensis]GID32559.1 hypothetical protein Abr02nite_75420 [Actinoplanes brasiliensis]
MANNSFTDTNSFGLDQCQARLHTAITRHTVLVMTALAICAIVAASLKTRTDTQAPAPNTPDQRPPAEPGMIPLTIPETARLLATPGTGRNPPTTTPTGATGDAATRPEHAGSTNAPDSTESIPWPTSKWRLPY